MRFSLAAAALVAPLVSAIQFTSPAANTTLTKGQVVDLTWTTVDTDPTVFSIYIVNFKAWPPKVEPVAYNVATNLQDIKVSIPCDLDNGYGFQFNAINGTNTYVIYAQTPDFFVDGASCTAVNPAASTCAPPTTVTVTVSAPNNSTKTAGNGGWANWSSWSTPAPSASCPSTIGWKGGYTSPVVLTSVPTPGNTGTVSPTASVTPTGLPTWASSIAGATPTSTGGSGAGASSSWAPWSTVTTVSPTGSPSQPWQSWSSSTVSAPISTYTGAAVNQHVVGAGAMALAGLAMLF